MAAGTDLRSKDIAILFLFYERGQQFSGGGHYAAELPIPAESLSAHEQTMILGRLASRELIEVSGVGDDRRLIYKITPAGVDAIDEIYERNPLAVEAAMDYLLRGKDAGEQGFVPAADRYVTKADNQPLFEEVQSSVSELREAVASSNDMEPLAKEIAVSEIAAFEATMQQPRVAIDLIDRFVKRILTWLAIKFPEAAYSAVVAILIERLVALAGVS